MNSLYKKITLVCLISLTANQAAQAFQISDIWSRVKNNPKSFSLGVAGTLAALIAIYYACNKTTRFSPIELYVNNDVFNRLTQNQPVEGVEYAHVRKTLGISSEGYNFPIDDQDRLSELCPQAPVYNDINLYSNYFLKVIRDPAKKNKIAGAIAYQKWREANRIDIKAFGTDHTYSSKDRIKMKKALLSPLLDTACDLKACDNDTHAWVGALLKERGDKHSYDSYEEIRDRLFDRSHLRPAQRQARQPEEA